MSNTIENQIILKPFLAALTGFLAWSGQLVLMPFSLAFPLIWAKTHSRKEAVLTAFSYHGAACIGLLNGATAYFGSKTEGFFFWFSATCLASAIYVLLWTDNRRRRPYLTVLAIILSAIPPFGLVGIANPITASGVIFPNTGVWGLLLTLLLITIMLRSNHTLLTKGIIFVSLFSVFFLHSLPKSPVGWIAINTTNGSNISFNRNNLNENIKNLSNLNFKKKSRLTNVILLPEDYAGRWNKETKNIIGSTSIIKNITILTGVSSSTGHALATICNDKSEIIYRQQIPIPISEWKPWNNRSAKTHIFSKSTFTLEKQKIAPFICFEQFLVWPFLKAVFCKPDILIGISDMWWAKNTNIPKIQKQIMSAWAMLFDSKIITAVNT